MSFWRFRTHRIPRMRDDLSYCPTSCPMTRSVFLKGPLATLALSVASSWKRRASLSQALQWRILSSTHLQTLLLEQLWTVTFFKSFFFFFLLCLFPKGIFTQKLWNLFSEERKWCIFLLPRSPVFLLVFSHRFVLTDADHYVLTYLESNSSQIPCQTLESLQQKLGVETSSNQPVDQNGKIQISHSGKYASLYNCLAIQDFFQKIPLFRILDNNLCNNFNVLFFHSFSVDDVAEPSSWCRGRLEFPRRCSLPN